MQSELVYPKESFRIVGVAMQVHRELGFGFLEHIYQNAMLIALADAGFDVQKEKPIQVKYREIIIGDFFADIVVNDKIILELKARDHIVDAHKAQTLNYLRATGMHLGILFNFGQEKLDYKRFVN